MEEAKSFPGAQSSHGPPGMDGYATKVALKLRRQRETMRAQGRWGMNVGEMVRSVSALAPGLTMHHQAIANLLRDESGQDLIEYALVASVLSLCAIASLQSVASKVLGLYQGIQAGLSSVL